MVLENKENKLTSEFFGLKVFDKTKMEKYLTTSAFEHVNEAIEKGIRIDRKIADQVALGMKVWALEMGATHYTHWFHPLTEGTAEKHDAFITIKEGKILEKFSGEMLAQQEPDASNFPSGGLRNTFEARGYTAWDPSSPAFIVGRTLSIPTIFISYTGEALDHKTPLLRSLHQIDKAAVEICQYFDKDVTKVHAMLGWEQEYFLVDESLFNERPDLRMTGRTLTGYASSRVQQLDYHYFSSIPERVADFMHDFETKAYILGIPVKTKHNEVAPNQFEVAPIQEECNLAVDHNLLLMDLMKKTARQHHFRVLFHEKPFKGINGSSKHNNWSLSTNTGTNLLSPGNKPKLNLQFLTFLVCTIKAVHEHQDLLRASIASAGNAHRLGGNEAPPSIISVFIGSQLTRLLEEIEKRVTNEKMSPVEKTELKLDIGKIPEILLDNTDKNRTSPFAFTGNRFEFRAVGASDNCASPMVVLNTAVADQLKKFKKEADKLLYKGVKKDEAIFQVLRKYIIESRKIRFEGNNYSEEWKKEAEKRGLSNIPSAIEAMEVYYSDKAKKLFSDNEIFTAKEIEARTDVRLEIYIKKILIESRVLEDMALNQVIPTAVDYQTKLVENVKGLKEIFSKEEFEEAARSRKELIKTISVQVDAIKNKVGEMALAREQAEKRKTIRSKAKEFEQKVIPFLESTRFHVDKLELIVDNKLWPLPKYGKLLFTR